MTIRKNSILKRTASEPKLCTLDTEVDSLEYQTNEKGKDELILESKDLNLAISWDKTLTENQKIKEDSPVSTDKKAKSSLKRSRLSGEKKITNDFDSPYNQIYFSNFERLAIELINKVKIKNTQTSMKSF